jgi:signal peptidase II
MNTVESTVDTAYQAHGGDDLSRLKDYLFLFGISGAIVALDQLTKYWVRSELAFGESISPIAFLENFVRIVHWNNTGAAFGILPSASLIITIVAIGVIIAIIYYFPRVPRDKVVMRIALSLQLGGAFGNLIDRIIQGTVTDFISVSRFPVFNVADASITVGTILLIGAMLLDPVSEGVEDLEPNTSVEPLPEDPPEVE